MGYFRFSNLLYSFIIATILSEYYHNHCVLAAEPTASSCQDKCGSLSVKYPLGTGYGCGSPRFYPYVSCSSTGDQLLFATHTGSYPITSVFYDTSTLIVTPPRMSNCSSMQASSNLGLDWPSPFQLGPSVFVLLSCAPPTSSHAVCDTTNDHLCASMHTCAAITSLGLSLFAPTDTCCVYTPANFNTKGELDLQALKCAGYTSVLSLGDLPMDPNRWEYGIALKYTQMGFDQYDVAIKCEACEKSDGICGYAPPQDDFVCVCSSGMNSSSDCYNPVPVPFWSNGSPGSPNRIPTSYAFHVCVLLFSILVVLL
ncbi:hypothetical protein GIB67_019324 [Kingdonia uniflora]|uniref:Wall-associated receptor kinase galacturonan-binding domain-containing protein n=1 Tax=Kingdonia uniflora TaxID=39325 RepID=A0A7J7M1G8_9MAGN|nr:hypothetical protein GIB67_019324 [Kingdonia uniflora]